MNHVERSKHTVTTAYSVRQNPTTACLWKSGHVDCLESGLLLCHSVNGWTSDMTNKQMSLVTDVLKMTNVSYPCQTHLGVHSPGQCHNNPLNNPYSKLIFLLCKHDSRLLWGEVLIRTSGTESAHCVCLHWWSPKECWSVTSSQEITSNLNQSWWAYQN